MYLRAAKEPPGSPSYKVARHKLRHTQVFLSASRRAQATHRPWYERLLEAYRADVQPIGEDDPGLEILEYIALLAQVADELGKLDRAWLRQIIDLYDDVSTEPPDDSDLQALYRLRVFAQVASAVKELEPGEFEKHAPKDIATVLNGDSTIEDYALEMLENHFPVDTLSMDDQLYFGHCYQDCPDQTFIEIRATGWWWVDDDFLVRIEDPSEFEDGDSFGIFIWALFSGYADEELWSRLATRFGWPVTRPDYLPRLAGFDRSVEFFKLLNDAGLEHFQKATEIVWQETGNPFLDLHPIFEYQREDGWEAPPLTAENIRKLALQWQETKPFYEAWNKVVKQVAEDADILKRFSDLLAKSITERKR